MILFLTSKTYKEARPSFHGRKVDFIDVPKMIEENFGNEKLDEVREWIMNEILRKKVLSLISSPSSNSICIRYKRVSKRSEDNLRKMIVENSTKKIQIKVV